MVAEDAAEAEIVEVDLVDAALRHWRDRESGVLHAVIRGQGACFERDIIDAKAPFVEGELIRCAQAPVQPGGRPISTAIRSNRAW